MKYVLAILACAFFVETGLALNRVLERHLEVVATAEIEFQEPYYGLSLHGLYDWTGISLVIDGVEYFPENDHHADGPSSGLFLFDEPIHKVVIENHASAPAHLTVKCYNGMYTPATMGRVNAVQLNHKKNNCDLPALIDQDIWREGLPDPKPNPAVTTVEHLIIHHSATSNTATDYLLAVRNIYLYHVNSNGWDDVGYNYLIDAAGTLYAGRDGQGKDDDNIRGAHFCAKNSNTMGVCLIGNYSEIPPPDTMIGTLTSLLAWKVKKEGLQPLESAFHPKGSATGFDLPVVCGHRDGYKAGVFEGCQTECPGNYTYEMLDAIKAQLVEKLLACDYAVHSHRVEPSELHVLMAGNRVQIAGAGHSRLSVYDPMGRVWWTGVLSREGSFQMELPNGIYLLRLEGSEGVRVSQIYVSQGSVR